MSRIFKRFSRVRVKDSIFTFPEFDIEHEIVFDDEKEPNISKITIYNLSQDSRSAFNKGDAIIYEAGTEDDFGTILSGVIFDTYSKQDGPDTAFIIKAYDIQDQYYNLKVSKTYKAGTTSRFIINDLISIGGLTTGRIDIKRNVNYKNGFSAFGTLKSILERLARDSESQVLAKNDSMNILPLGESLTEVFVLSKNTELLSVDPIDSITNNATHKLTSLLNHSIHVRSVVQVESEELNGLCLVLRGKHNKEWNTEMEVSVIESS